MKRILGTVIVAFLLLVGIASLARGAESASESCDADPATRSVAGYGGEQLANAQTIIDTAAGLGLSPRAQLLGVMAAMGESGLRVLDYGDWETSGVRNPDGTPTSSIGLFQQQDWWGTEAERLDPAQSATLFFRRLVEVPGWEFLPATQAIHQVQANTDPWHYEKWEGPAEEVVTALRDGCG